MGRFFNTDGRLSMAEPVKIFPQQRVCATILPELSVQGKHVFRYTNKFVSVNITE